MILLSVMRKFNNLHYLNDSPCSLCPKIFKEKAEVIEPMEVQRYKQIEISNVSRNLFEY